MHAQLDVIAPAYDAIEHNKFTALLLMDLRNAFDTVSHQILLQKLLHYGIRGPAYCLIESYLSNRQQFASINNSASSLKSISIGIPSTLLLLYYSLVQPHLVYRLPIWGNTFETYLSKKQTLQNKAVRVITNSDLRIPKTPKYRNLKILKITELYTFEIAKLMHQHSKNSLPSAFQLFLLRFPTFMEDKPSQKQKATSTFPNSLHADVKGH